MVNFKKHKRTSSNKKAPIIIANMKRTFTLVALPFSLLLLDKVGKNKHALQGILTQCLSKNKENCQQRRVFPLLHC